MQLKSVLLVFCALALALASAEFSVFRQKRVVALVPGFSVLCALSGNCGGAGRNYNNWRGYHPHQRYGPYYHNKYIPRARDTKHVYHHHTHHGYHFG
uniref:Secreted protein n=1 Tax=Steinernema glaseri TaxID=37863 RepID=A0A1I7YU31_9BILA